MGAAWFFSAIIRLRPIFLGLFCFSNQMPIFKLITRHLVEKLINFNPSVFDSEYYYLYHPPALKIHENKCHIMSIFCLL